MTPTEARLPLLTLGVLFVGYACSYFHRADLAVLLVVWNGTAPALAAALPDIASLGLFVYALGKFAGGMLADRFGGRRLFVLALAIACLAELAAALCTAPWPFAVCRVIGMAVLALAWPALGSIVAEVVPRHRLATAMAFYAQSYLLGDAAVRAVLAAVVKDGGGAPEVLRTSASWLGGAALLAAVVFGLARHRHPRSGRTVAMPAESAPGNAPPMRWLAAMNFALALGRESLSFWGARLLVEVGALAADQAVWATVLLSIAGGVGALVAGPFADRGRRALVVVLVLPSVLAGVALAVLALAPTTGLVSTVVLLVVASGALAIPNSLASGALPLRAARAGAARRLGLVDGFGTLGAVLAGTGVGRVREAFGTASAFWLLVVAAVVALVAAVFYLRALPNERRALTDASAADPPRR